MTCLIPTYIPLSLKGVAHLFQDHVWKDFGILENIIYDWGSIFCLQIHGSPKSPVRNSNEPIHFISPSNQWVNQMSKPRKWTVSWIIAKTIGQTGCHLWNSGGLYCPPLIPAGIWGNLINLGNSRGIIFGSGASQIWISITRGMQTWFGILEMQTGITIFRIDWNRIWGNF